MIKYILYIYQIFYNQQLPNFVKYFVVCTLITTMQV